MGGFTKLFSSIVTSTIWCEDAPTRVVWVAMLALKDRDGIVEGSIPGFARVANVTLAEMEKAVQVLTMPDPHSRTPDNQGRRIEVIPGGWRVLNHEAYRALESEDHRREMDAARQRRHRENESRNVTLRHASSPHSYTDADTDTENRESKPKERGSQPQAAHPSPAATKKQVPSIPPASTPRPRSGGSLPGVDVGVGVGHPQNQAKAGSVRSSAFVKPTAAEVTAYAAGIGFQLDGEAFVAFYESKGWVVGRTPMRNWKAAVVTWKKRDGGQRHEKRPGVGFRNDGQDPAGAIVL